ncbi:NADPH-dependent assimilatory sulfite reductase hemoprotein subunit [Tengunoibacter tsumagoiensis]|uniref:assimilatory sulfite reductase (NADPH) n=1 Tax=Tengunoibacter tsumagoiensis TaxID=2014871 RepID=A0A402A3R1_9CHLR|nr:NADPH-dependent assimilatory sulfite reductase hemoprotein subunit [Tengunoibacter tsumagoiensis]GCE13787.1 sulfite reductase subunit beta [Tengunoibacter tsumagoiensis]
MSSEQDRPKPTSEGNNLLALGEGNGSKVEQIKLESRHLRGTISEELKLPTSHLSEDLVQLIKFHGSYQQEDRDQRQSRKASGEEKAYQFMVRSRIPGGIVTADQYLLQDDLTNRIGNSTLRVTTRQSFQIHGILKGNLHEAIHSINTSLLSTLSACGDVNRNVMACPAPVASRAQAQVQEIAREIAFHLAPRSRAYYEIWIDGEHSHDIEAPGEDEVVEPIYGNTYLPRKFKIGVAYPGDNCIDIYTQDIGLIAKIENETLVGFTLVIGGGMGTTHGKAETHPLLAQPFADVTVEQALPVVETIVTVQRDYGDRQNRKHARMKYVVEERGIPWFKAEVEQRLGYTLANPSPVHFHELNDHLGWQQQADGRWCLGLNIVNGRIKDTGTLRLKSGLRAITQEFQPEFRLTGQQNILLANIPEEQKAALEARLSEFGISSNPDDAGTYRFAMACPALPTCGLAVAESERLLPNVVKQIEGDLQALGLADEKISIRMTGCPNGCARPYMGDIGLVGRSKDIYNLYLGGDTENTRLNTLYAQGVKTAEIAPTLLPLFSFWKNERQNQEGFGDYCHRIGFAQLKEKAAAHITIG